MILDDFCFISCLFLKAYHNWLSKKGEETWKLPGIDLTSEQLFYVGFGQVGTYKVNIVKQWLIQLNPLEISMQKDFTL